MTQSIPITAESIVGTIVGSMMALRKGPNYHTEDVVDAVLQQLDLLRSELFTLRTDNDWMRQEIKKLHGSHNPEVCVDVQEYAETLKAEVKRLRPLINILTEGLEAVEALISQSHGVDGLHLSGDVAPWHELRTGEAFGAWLEAFDVALDAARAQENPDELVHPSE